MLATVPNRCMSSGPGSPTSGSRCIRTPTWRCSRTACWAAVIERGRPTVTGSTVPGNSTMSRTGRMMSASGGNGGSDCAGRPGLCSSGLRASMSATRRLHLLQRDHQATVDGRAPHAGIASGRQAHAPLKAALRQLQPMNDGGAQLAREGTNPVDDEIGAVDHGLDTVGADAGQRHEYDDVVLGCQDVDGRLPGRNHRTRARQAKKFAMHPLGLHQHRAGFRPHPGKISVHATPFAGPSCEEGAGQIQWMTETRVEAANISGHTPACREGCRIALRCCHAACSTSPRVRGEVDLRAEPWRSEANRVRGLVHKLRLAATPPHPDSFAALGIRPRIKSGAGCLPAQWGEVAQVALPRTSRYQLKCDSPAARGERWRKWHRLCTVLAFTKPQGPFHDDA